MSIVVDQENQAPETPQPAGPGGELVSWVMDKVNAWRTHRDTQHQSKWDEYYRLWRTQFADTDRARKSERSKIVAPATMQAIDSTIAEIEEAVFGREQWVDLAQDVKQIEDPKARDLMLAVRDTLLERMNDAAVPTSCAEAFLIGTIYGTGIGKINVKVEPSIVGPDGQKTNERVVVEVLPLEPYEFVPDPTTNKIDEMLGMAHETPVPLHTIRTGQREGRYFDAVRVQPWSGETPGDSKDPEIGKLSQGQSVYITEYHGLVPVQYLYKAGALPADPELEQLFESEDYRPEDNLIEAIVTIANKGQLLGAKKNPFYGADRSFIAYQHDTVPRYFWGRGVSEKGYQPQKGLDAELRARLDALALISHPMVAGDVSRLPRGMNLSVWPGKFWPTTGNPNEILQPFQFGNLNPATFTNSADMERMVQMATGAMDPTSSAGQNASPTQTALHSAAFVKRARRAMQNIERNWLQPMVRKITLRYMQFAPKEFPFDPGFKVRGSLGVMARELEQQQLTQLLSIVPNESPPFLVLLKAIFDNSSSPHKGDMVKAVDQMLQPPSQEAQQEQAQMKQLALRAQVAQTAELEAKAQKAAAEAQRALAQANLAKVEADLKDDELINEQIGHAIDQREVQAFEMQNQVSLMMQHLRAVEVALKAMEAPARISKLNAEAAALENGTKQVKTAD